MLPRICLCASVVLGLGGCFSAPAVTQVAPVTVGQYRIEQQNNDGVLAAYVRLIVSRTDGACFSLSTEIVPEDPAAAARLAPSTQTVLPNSPAPDIPNPPPSFQGNLQSITWLKQKTVLLKATTAGTGKMGRRFEIRLPYRSTLTVAYVFTADGNRYVVPDKYDTRTDVQNEDSPVEIRLLTGCP